MLSHGNIIADMSAAVVAGLALSNDDVHLSYLPLAHMFERIVQVRGVWLCRIYTPSFGQGNC